jgi:rhodanese-related sulfurtransferase
MLQVSVGEVDTKHIKSLLSDQNNYKKQHILDSYYLSNGKFANIFIDVRTREEYTESSIRGFVLLPINEPDFVQRLQNILDTEIAQHSEYNIYFLCRSGKRSLLACEMCSKGLQFDSPKVINFINIKGGILEYATSI